MQVKKLNCLISVVGCLYKDRRWIIKRFTTFYIVESKSICNAHIITKEINLNCIKVFELTYFQIFYYYYYCFFGNLITIQNKLWFFLIHDSIQRPTPNIYSFTAELIHWNARYMLISFHFFLNINLSYFKTIFFVKLPMFHQYYIII